jgi:UDP-N-acetylmuramoyl-L-alanyl-D-glutamate--2,6-diaminopimelate ligase
MTIPLRPRTPNLHRPYRQQAENLLATLFASCPARRHLLRAVLDDHRRLIANPELGKSALFIALKGDSFDARSKIDEIMAYAPLAILIQADDGLVLPTATIEALSRKGITWAMLNGFPDHAAMQECLGELSALVWGNPSHRLRVHAVTGTNGKTSVTWAMAHALQSLGRPCGMIGTLGAGMPDALQDTGMTTPSAAVFQEQLANALHLGCTDVAVEVSSIALAQSRVAGCEFFSASFTNLSHDHLDYHGNMEAYGNAKARLFQDFSVAHAIINIDEPFGKNLSHLKGPKNAWTVGEGLGDSSRHWRVDGKSPRHFQLTPPAEALSSLGLATTTESLMSPLDFSCPWIGKHNLDNVVPVVINLLLIGETPSRIRQALAQLPMPKGRLERIYSNAEQNAEDDVRVWVDYAHTPDALEKALQVLRSEHPNSRLICLFGCGGNRDRSKRAVMGNIALKYADFVIATSDNPRKEDPHSILRDIYPVVPRQVTIEIDRQRAIRHAISQANPGDTVLIAGKGHESYQEIQGVRHPFSDQVIVQQALIARLQYKEKA